MHKKQNKTVNLSLLLHQLVCMALSLTHFVCLIKRGAAQMDTAAHQGCSYVTSQWGKKKSCDLPISDNPGLHTCVVYCAADKKAFSLSCFLDLQQQAVISVGISVRVEHWEATWRSSWSNPQKVLILIPALIFPQKKDIYPDPFYLSVYGPWVFQLLFGIITARRWSCDLCVPLTTGCYWCATMAVVHWIMGLYSDNALRLNLYSLPLDRFAVHMYWHVITRPLRNAHAGFDGQL